MPLKKRLIPQDGQLEHQNRDEGRQAAEAGGCHRPKQSRQEQQEQEI